MKRNTLFLSGLLVAAVLAGCASPQSNLQSKLLVALPDYCNTPDGMCLRPDQSIIVSIPNFNDETKPPLLMKITPDNKAEKFYEFPTPFPGLPAGVDRIAPMGIACAPSGDLYLADMAYTKDKNQKSRLWKLVVKDGKVDKMVRVASGFNVANGVVIHGGYCYITESVLVEDSHPLISAVLRFKLDEENVQLKTPLNSCPTNPSTTHRSNPSSPRNAMTTIIFIRVLDCLYHIGAGGPPGAFAAAGPFPRHTTIATIAPLFFGRFL